MRNLNALYLPLFVIYLFLATSCEKEYGQDDLSIETPVTKAETSSQKLDQPVVVTYEVISDDYLLDVRYNVNGKIEKSCGGKTFNFEFVAKTKQDLKLKAESKARNNTSLLEVNIYIDGKLVDHRTGGLNNLFYGATAESSLQ